ncbi:hypothetical protein DMENIID0001_152130 [Sergentomyia squamirostris]
MKGVKKKKISKKNKSAWRKHVDITDVDNFLETSRLEERIGTIDDAPDSSLFQVDKTPSKKSQKTSVKSKRKVILSRPLKCLSSLENNSKVTDPLTKRDKVKNRKNIVTMKHSAKSNSKLGKADEKQPQIAFDHDLWNDDKPTVEVEKKKSELEDKWFTKKIIDHNLRNTGVAAFKVPKTAVKKTSKLTAFEPPHPGMSYNPKKEDYVSLMDGVVSDETNIIKKNNHLDRVTTQMFKKISAEERDKQILQEMSAGLGFDVEIKQEDEIKQEFPDEETYSTINPPVESKPKSKQALRKKAEERKRRNLLQKSKIEKKKISDIIQIGRVKQAIVKREMKVANRRNKEEKEEEQKNFQPRRLGPMAFKEVDIDVAYPEEITGNLRTTKVTGNILKDRYVSLQKRNMVAPSKRQGVRKRHKVKSYVKNTHKGAIVKPINAKK